MRARVVNRSVLQELIVMPCKVTYHQSLPGFSQSGNGKHVNLTMRNLMRDFRLPPRVNWNCVLQGHYVASSGNSSPKFLGSYPLKMGAKSCPETSVRSCHLSLRKSPEEHSFQCEILVTRIRL